MLTIMSFVLPSVLGIKIFMNLNKSKKGIDIVIFFLLFLLFSNFISMIIANIINADIYSLTDYINNSLDFTIYYILNSLIINVILSIIFTIIDKYVTFDIEVKNEKKTKKRKNN